MKFLKMVIIKQLEFINPLKHFTLNRKNKMKARIVHGRNIGTYEVEVKEYWLSPWKPLYVNGGMFPWRGSYNDAIKIKAKAEKQ